MRLFSRSGYSIDIILIQLIIALLIFQPASALPRCYTGCTANDVEIMGFTLLPSGICTSGTTNADLYMHFKTNRVNTYCIYVVFDVYTDNNQLLQKDVSVVLGTYNRKVDLNQKLYTINWPCGKNLFIRNIYTQWSQNDPSPNLCAYNCISGTGSKCSEPEDLAVLIPGIDVTKVVNGPCESGTLFPITVSGPGYSASHSFACSGGHFIFTNMAPGTYTVAETVPAGWTVSGSPQAVSVVSGLVSTAIVSNSRDTGSLAVSKQVHGQCEYGTSFPIFISGPGGYSAVHTFSCSGGSYTVTNLPTGTYTITEMVPEGWTAAGSPQTVTVPKGAAATATVTNIRDTGSLMVSKHIEGQCDPAVQFAVSISGPGGYLASHNFDCSGGSYTFTDLPTGLYTIKESVREGWTAAGSLQTVTVSKGATANATITNMRDTGSLMVSKHIEGQCDPAAQFEISISGPGGYLASHNFDSLGGSYTFTDLPTGTYTITETVQEGWTAAVSPQTVTVSKGATTTATVTNIKDTGCLTVTKQVQGQCAFGTQFPIWVSGPGGYLANHTFNCSGGSYRFANLSAGSYTVTETVPTGWIVLGSPQTVAVSNGSDVTAIIINSKCQIANAGADREACEGYPVMLEGSAINATSVEWSVKLGSGTFIWPYEGSDFKALYSPPLSGESTATLIFKVNGACQSVSDSVNISVVERPIATITVMDS